MRVPIKSAGTRSGVNWMRLNSPPIASASVLMAIVFASPGTPSTRMCPRASSATTNRSNRWSCPTITFFTSYNPPSPGNPREKAGGPARNIDRHRKADADKDILLGRIHDPHDDADHLAVAIKQRTARVAGIHGRVYLNQVLQFLVAVRGLERT